MELKSKLYLLDDKGDKFMGVGVLWLLRAVESEGSLRKAASSLEISYSKAYAMIEKAEEVLAFPLVERQKGGMERKGSSLTPFGKQFCALYDGFQKEAKECLLSPYDKFCKALTELMEEQNGR